MPVDFDDEDIADVIEEVDSPQSQIMPEQEPDVEEQMSEVEAKLEIAQYYRLILNETLFDDAPNPEVAERVEQEIRGFIRGRMGVLMGVQAPEAKAVKLFTDAEVQALRTLAQPEVQEALKALAAKVLKKPAILEAKPLTAPKPKPEQKLEPILRKVGQGQRRAQQAPQPQLKVGKQKKQFKTVTSEDGKEVKMDVTPQARPTGTIQPIPTPRGRDQIEAMSAQSAAYQARVAMNTLERNLRGKE